MTHLHKSLTGYNRSLRDKMLKYLVLKSKVFFTIWKAVIYSTNKSPKTAVNHPILTAAVHSWRHKISFFLDMRNLKRIVVLTVAYPEPEITGTAVVQLQPNQFERNSGF